MENQNTIFVYSSGILVWKGKEYNCALGKNGVSFAKKEGDNATPTGCFNIREVYYRKDKIGELETVLPLKILLPDDGWCDDSENKEYNTFVKLPYQGSHEKLWREDDVYDVIVPIGYNDNPPVPGKGSAIFMHVAREGYTPTAGCIALSLQDLLEILKSVDAETLVCITEESK